MEENEALIPAERTEKSILVIRGHRVMLDADLADLYGVPTKLFNQAAIRNLLRFPSDFTLQLTQEEFERLRLQFATSSWGGRRYLPYAFTEQGVAMLSSVLRSECAVQVNIEIMRALAGFRFLAILAILAILASTTTPWESA